ncbi:MAG: hypothetical protein ACWA41_01820 [Putridiphycobacter sp.]
MRANIIKAFSFFFFLDFFAPKLNAQILIDVDFDVIGTVYDFADDPYNNQIIVVGDLTSIQGVAVNNIAVIDKATMTVNVAATSSLQGVNGKINSVEFDRVNQTSSSLGFSDLIFIGGEFTAVNGAPCPYFGRFSKAGTDLTYVHDTSFTLNMDTTQVGSKVNDLIIEDQKIIIGGAFSFFTGESYSALANMIGLSYDYQAFTWNSNIANPSPWSASGSAVAKFEKKIDRLFIYGINSAAIPNYFVAQDTTFGQTNPPFAQGLPTNLISPVVVEAEEPFLLTCGSNTAGSWNGETSEIHKASIPSPYYNFSTTATTSNCNTSDPLYYFDMTCTSTKSFLSIGSHGEKAIIGKLANETTFKLVSYMVFDFADSVQPEPKTFVWIKYGLTQNSFELHPFSSSNYLGFSARKLLEISTDNGHHIDYPSINQSFYNGLVLFCMEPEPIDSFQTLDTLVCPGDTVNFVADLSPNADGYTWEYTGTGVDFGADDSGNEDLTDTLYGGNSNVMQIHILNNFTPGQLIVRPVANGSGHTINGELAKGKPIYANLTYYNQPNIYVTVDTTLNCLRDTVNLSGYSDSLNVSYHWQDEFGGVGATGQDTLAQTSDFTIANPNGYLDFIFQVTDTVTFCYNTDTVRVWYDTILPNITLPTTGNFELNCDVDTVFVPFTSANANVTFFWSNGTDTTYNDTILADNFGSYYPSVKDTLNGCINDGTFFVTQNITPPTAELVGFASVPTLTPLDTITCYNDSITFISTSSTSNTISQWYDAGNTLTGNDTITITQGGNYTFNVKDTTNGCVTDKTIIVDENTLLPVVTLSNDSTLNCSVDSVQLMATTITTDTVLTWTDPNNNVFNSGNLTTGTVGWHYLNVIRNDNGCEYLDSIEVIFEPTISLITADTLICDSTAVDLTVGYLGNLTNTTYLWDNGQTTAMATYNSGLDSMAIVTLLADNGCNGTDTIFINQPDRVEADITAFAACAGGNTGQLVINVTNGMPPYMYSLNNSAAQTDAFFQNLTLGNYVITVFDGLGCGYNFSATVDENGLPPEPNFIFSTYNIQSDTLVVIDISNPPADNVTWTFPPEVTILDNSNPTAPVIILPDTGVFQIGMDAHYGSCTYTINKDVYVSAFDTTLATSYNQNGIKSVQLYPNPNTGVFTVEIEFYNKQNAVTLIQDMTSYTYYYQETDESSLTFTHQIDLGSNVQPGTYVLKVASEFDSYYLTFIITD